MLFTLVARVSIGRRSRASCLSGFGRGLIFHHFLFLGTLTFYFIFLIVMNYHLIHAQQDGLVVD